MSKMFVGMWVAVVATWVFTILSSLTPDTAPTQFIWFFLWIGSLVAWTIFVIAIISDMRS